MPSQSRSPGDGGGGGGGDGAVGPAVQQGAQGLDDDAHVGTEVPFVLDAQGSHSSHLLDKNMVTGKNHGIQICGEISIH